MYFIEKVNNRYSMTKINVQHPYPYIHASGGDREGYKEVNNSIARTSKQLVEIEAEKLKCLCICFTLQFENLDLYLFTTFCLARLLCHSQL